MKAILKESFKVASKIAVGVLALSQLSCTSPEDNIAVSYKGGNVLLIPAGTRSCRALYEFSTPSTDLNVSSRYFQLKNMTLTWKKSTTFRLEVIRVSVEDAQMGTISCVIDSEEQKYLTAQVATAWSRTLSGVNDRVTFSCPITCGGISPPAKGNFTANGIIEIIGVETAQNGDETPIYKSEPVTIQNLF